MTWKTWVLVIASVLVSSILLEGRVFAAGERKKIVMIDPNLAEPQRQQQFDQLPEVLTKLKIGFEVVHNLEFIYALAIELSLNETLVATNEALELLLMSAGVSAKVDDDLVVSVNRIYSAEIPSTQTYDWGLEHIRVDVAHEKMPEVTGTGVQVAVLDTGVGPHAELTIEDGYNALPGGVQESYSDVHGHGTHIAGIIAASAKNNAGLIGAAPDAGIIAVKVLDDNGKGYLSNLLNGLQWVHNRNIRLVNMSLGFSTDSRPLKTAIRELYFNGTIMVASAGNKCSDNGDYSEDGGEEGEGPTCDTPQTKTVKFPAAYEWVLAVAASDINNQITGYSVAGAAVDITAPGGVLPDTLKGSTGTINCPTCILSTYKGFALYGYGSGTSQAAAHVTGALALKLQQDSQTTLSEVQVQLCQTAKDLGQNYDPKQQGCGLIDVEGFLAEP